MPPGRALHGRVVSPGSKSITNRALLLAALAQGTSRLTGALKNDDTANMAAALRGAAWAWMRRLRAGARRFLVRGRGGFAGDWVEAALAVGYPLQRIAVRERKIRFRVPERGKRTFVVARRATAPDPSRISNRKPDTL